MWKKLDLASATAKWLFEPLLLHCLQSTFVWMIHTEETWLLPQSVCGLTRQAGATHVRLGLSLKVSIQVSSHLKAKDQRFGTSAVGFF